MRAWWSWVLCAAAFAASGCSAESDPSPVTKKAVGAAGLAAEAGNPAAAPGSFKFQDAEGKTLFRVRPTDDGFKFKLEDDTAAGEVKVQEDRVKLRDASDVELWKIKRKKDGAAEIEDAQGNRLFRVRPDGDGWKLQDASETTLAKSKAKDTGFELRDAAGATIAKAKKRDGKVVLENEAGERLFEVDGIEDARAAQWFAYDKFTIPQRAALCAYFLKVQK